MDSFNLKVLACVLMFIDHFSLLFLNNNFYGRSIGRLAFPIFAYLIAINFDRTSSKFKYFSRLLLFAVISQIPFYWYVHGNLNIFFTLSIGFIACYFWGHISESILYKLGLLFVFILCLMPIDYGLYGVFLVLLFYIFRESLIAQFIACLILNLLFFRKLGSIQLFSVFAFVPLYFYNGEKGLSLKSVKYAFYSFYPVHLMLLLVMKHIKF